MLTDTVQSHSSLIQRCGVRYPGKDLGVPLLLFGVHSASECYFDFLSFFIKMQNLFGFLSVSEDRYRCRSFVKAEQQKANF